LNIDKKTKNDNFIKRENDSTKKAIELMYKIIASIIILLWPVCTFAETKDRIDTKNYIIVIKGDLGEFKLQSEVKEVEPGLELVTIKLNADKLSSPPKVTFFLETSLYNVAGFWSAEKEWSKECIWQYEFTSRLATYARVITYFSTENANVQTFDVSDAINSIPKSAKVNEVNGNSNCSISLPNRTRCYRTTSLQFDWIRGTSHIIKH